MKKIMLALMAVAGLFILSGCADSPKDVTKKWMKALINKDVKTANEYSTSRVHTLNALAISALSDKDSGEKVTKEFQESMDRLDKAEVKIEGDTAQIYMKSDEETPMTLKKVDGKWKVDVKK